MPERMLKGVIISGMLCYFKHLKFQFWFLVVKITPCGQPIWLSEMFSDVIGFFFCSREEKNYVFH
jgi:hypothetical protein